MQAYSLNCAFLLEYNTKQITLNINLSKQFVEKNKLKYTELALTNNELSKFVHRYDYRKLDYFVESEISGIFDTLMRFTLKKCKYPLRTVAICKVTNNGLKCAHFEESKIVQLRNSRLSELSNKQIKRVNIENENEVLGKQHTFISEVKSHLACIIDREQKIV